MVFSGCDRTDFLADVVAELLDGGVAGVHGVPAGSRRRQRPGRWSCSAAPRDPATSATAGWRTSVDRFRWWRAGGRKRSSRDHPPQQPDRSPSLSFLRLPVVVKSMVSKRDQYVSLNRSGSPQIPRSMAGQGFADHQEAAMAVGHRFAKLVDDVHGDAGSGTWPSRALVAVMLVAGRSSGAGLGSATRCPRSVRGAACVRRLLALAPMTSRYHIQASRVDGFPDGAQDADRGEVELGRDVLAPLHERADRGGGGVEDGDLVLLHSHQRPWCGSPGCLRT